MRKTLMGFAFAESDSERRDMVGRLDQNHRQVL